MIGASHAIETDRLQLSFLDRAAAWLATGLAVWVFFELGWAVLRPDDPQAPVSVMTRHGAIAAVLVTLVMFVVCAAVGTVLAGRRLPDIGTFAALVGATALSFRGATAEYFMFYGSAGGRHSPRLLGFLFFGESLVWIVLGACAVLASGWIVSRIYGQSGVEEGAKGRRPLSAGEDIRGFSRRTDGVRRAPEQTLATLGLKHAGIVAVAGLVAYTLLSFGSTHRVIQHGQAVFTVFAAVCVACYVGFHILPVRSALWPMLGVCGMICVGYLFAAIRPGSAELPPSVPPSPFLRVLPIQAVGIGLVAAIIMFWKMYMAPEPDAQPKAAERSR